MLLGAAMAGEKLLFARQDEVEAAWRIVDPIIDDPAPIIEYDPDTWGPAEAERLIPGGWNNPRPAA
jgi:glucose-6-phosphate 1-dehydrogenase